MVERITDRHLEGLVNRLNRLAGTPLEPYSHNEEGRLVANIGNFHIDHAYGGVSLCQMNTLGGGVKQPLGCGHVSKRELYERTYAFLRGVEAVIYGDIPARQQQTQEAQQ